MQIWRYIFGTLILVVIALGIAVFQLPDRKFHLIACDVGQGDAILITYGPVQILTDGGPDKKVLDCLGKYLPFWDRELELVILTHPQKDHYQGLVDVFRRYKVDNFMYNRLAVSSPDYQVLEKEVGGCGVRLLDPVNDRRLRVGMIYLDILNPPENVLGGGTGPSGTVRVTDSEMNHYSIVSLVSFKKFRALLAGDMPPEVSDRLSRENLSGPVNYIKIPHHGSRNGLTENLLKVLVPKVAVISVGKNNIYGHPNKEILDMLRKYGVKIFRTDEMGDIETVTDGTKYQVKK